MSTPPRGHFKVARKAYDPVHGDPWCLEPRAYSRWEAWLFLIQLAQWQPSHTRQTKYGLLTCKRGEFVVSLRWLAEQLGWGHERVRRFLGECEKTGRLARQSESHAGRVYLIVNYDTYQSTATERETVGETDNETNARQTRDKNKQEKQEKQNTKNKPKGTAAPWMGEITAAWKAATGGLPRAGSATILAPLVGEHGIADVVARLGRYLAGTDPQYVSVRRFAETFGAWGGPVPVADDMPVPDFGGGDIGDVDAWYAQHPHAA